MRRLTFFIAAATVAALLAPAAASASHRQFTMLEAPRELRSPDAALREHTLDEMRSLGAKWTRVVMYWRDVAPDADSRHQPDFHERDPDAYDWSMYDRQIDEARAKGIHILLTLTGPVPRWATLGGSDVKYPSRTHFGRFVRAAGRHFRSRVKYWSIWNEPNHPDFLGPQFRHGRPYSPKLYRKLFRAAWRNLNRSGNRHDKVLMGETAPRGSKHVVAPLRFLRGVLCLNRHYHKRHHCKKLRPEGYAHHAYTTHAGPRFKSDNRDDVTIGTLGRLKRALDRSARAHAIPRHLRIYLTEFGIQSKPDPFYGVGERRQNEYRAISERIAYKHHRVAAFSQYLMRDDLPREGRPWIKYGGFESGLRHSGGNKKKAYPGFRLPLVADRISRHRVRLWGLVRPARGHTHAKVLYRNRRHHRRHGHRFTRWHRVKRVRTDHRGYWRTVTRFRRHRQYRVVWHHDGHRFKSPAVRITRG